jgi:hypothetical protein
MMMMMMMMMMMTTVHEFAQEMRIPCCKRTEQAVSLLLRVLFEGGRLELATESFLS